jgi:argininosuccinate synthase
MLPALQAGAFRSAVADLATALTHAVIAKHLVRIADLEDAPAVAHCSQDAVQQRLFERSVGALARGVKVLTAVSAGRGATSEVRSSLLGRFAAVSDSSAVRTATADDFDGVTRSPTAAPDAAAVVEIGFRKGVPVAINGVGMPLVELVQSLETIAGAHGVGRVVERRGTSESPAVTALQVAHADLQQQIVGVDRARRMNDLAGEYAAHVLEHGWFDPSREALDCIVADLQESVTGTSHLRLCEGECVAVDRQVGVVAVSDVDSAVLTV